VEKLGKKLGFTDVRISEKLTGRSALAERDWYLIAENQRQHRTVHVPCRDSVFITDRNPHVRHVFPSVKAV
jgi:hypothetical protein